jgi:hypothetical protein
MLLLVSMEGKHEAVTEIQANRKPLGNFVLILFHPLN